MLISALTLTLSDDEIRDITKNHILQALLYGQNELEVVLREARVKNVLNTSSSGRFLDSVSSLLGLTYSRTYEGEPAMRLESLGEYGNPDNIKKEPIISFKKEIRVLNTDNILNYLTINQNELKKQDIAAFAQKYLAVGISNMALETAKDEHIDTIAISGGVLVNQYISNTIVKTLEKGGIKVLVNEDSFRRWWFSTRPVLYSLASVTSVISHSLLL
jgi:hydrogenase maturation protein HypF